MSHQPRTSNVYPTFWYLAAERQRIFFKKAQGAVGELTEDPILQRYRFTNAYRAADRVSQFLIRNVLYGAATPVDTFLRAVLFRLFNRIDTWEFLEETFGPVTVDSFSVAQFAEALDRRMQEGHKLYSAAYIMPSAKETFGHARKHRNHLELVQLMVKTNAPNRVAAARRLSEVNDVLLSYPSIGPFLAFQLTIDLNYSELINFSEMDFVVAGPGAKSGIRKCFTDVGSWTEADVIRYVTERQQTEFERVGEHFLSLWGRPLQLVDVQNLFCEIDKYARVAYPNVAGIGQRTRIKRGYVPTAGKIDYWFPPKWRLTCRAAA